MSVSRNVSLRSQTRKENKPKESEKSSIHEARLPSTGESHAAVQRTIHASSLQRGGAERLPSHARRDNRGRRNNRGRRSERGRPSEARARNAIGSLRLQADCAQGLAVRTYCICGRRGDIKAGPRNAAVLRHHNVVAEGLPGGAHSGRTSGRWGHGHGDCSLCADAAVQSTVQPLGLKSRSAHGLPGSTHWSFLAVSFFWCLRGCFLALGDGVERRGRGLERRQSCGIAVALGVHIYSESTPISAMIADRPPTSSGT